MLVASLHQGLVDLHPTRLEFYEAWLSPVGLREGRIGLAPLAAVLSFLRQEGEPYRLVAARAGEYTAEWTYAGLPSFERAAARAAPPWLRVHLAMRIARRMIRATCQGSRTVGRWRKGRGIVDIRGSIFCEVRDRWDHPLCEFYASALRRLMQLFDLEVEVATEACRATGAGHCLMSIVPRPAGTAG